MDVGCTLDRLDDRLRPWAPTSASRAISAVAELLVLSASETEINRNAKYHYLKL